MKPSKKVSGSVGGLSVFDRGFLSIYSVKGKNIANTAVVVSGVAAVGLVGYAFWRGEKRR